MGADIMSPRPPAVPVGPKPRLAHATVRLRGHLQLHGELVQPLSARLASTRRCTTPASLRTTRIIIALPQPPERPCQIRSPKRAKFKSCGWCREADPNNGYWFWV